MKDGNYTEFTDGSYFSKSKYVSQDEQVIRRNYRDLLFHTMNATDGRFSKVIDFGCGVGVGAAELDKLLTPDALIGIDISSQAIKKAEQEVDRESITWRSLDVKEETHRLKEEFGLFDLIFSRDTLEHIPRDDHDRYFSAFVDLLHPDGVFAAQSPNRFNPISYQDSTHRGLRSPGSWKRLSERYFSDVSVHTKQYIPVVWRIRQRQELSEFHLPIVGYNIYIIAKGIR